MYMQTYSRHMHICGHTHAKYRHAHTTRHNICTCPCRHACVHIDPHADLGTHMAHTRSHAYTDIHEHAQIYTYILRNAYTFRHTLRHVYTYAHTDYTHRTQMHAQTCTALLPTTLHEYNHYPSSLLLSGTLKELFCPSVVSLKIFFLEVGRLWW